LTAADEDQALLRAMAAASADQAWADFMGCAAPVDGGGKH
jgi:hypothetical protein